MDRGIRSRSSGKVKAPYTNTTGRLDANGGIEGIGGIGGKPGVDRQGNDLYLNMKVASPAAYTSVHSSPYASTFPSKPLLKTTRVWSERSVQSLPTPSLPPSSPSLLLSPPSSPSLLLSPSPMVTRPTLQSPQPITPTIGDPFRTGGSGGSPLSPYSRPLSPHSRRYRTGFTSS